MRLKFLSLVVLLSISLLGLFALATKKTFPGSNAPGSQTNNEGAEANPGSIETVKLPRKEPAASSFANGLAAPKDDNSTLAQHQTYVEKRTEELMDLAMSDDRSSLETILSELTNRDPEIRKAALQATIQFGSRDAIPKLMDVVSQVDDPKEKADIVEAIEFLKLPSATEVAAQSQPRSVARKPNVAKPAIPLPAALPK